jgi:hypothetical protein
MDIEWKDEFNTEILRQDENFKYFIAGFVAGEGCFGFNEKNRCVQFAIGLHIRDKQILLDIQKVIGAGTVRSFPCRPNMVRYQIGGIYNVLCYVIPFMNKYLIHSYKKDQYLIWREKVMSTKMTRIKGGGKHLKGNNV